MKGSARRHRPRPGSSPSQVEAIAYAHHLLLRSWALDENGKALRPALIWMDVRANAEADAVLATGRCGALRERRRGQGPVSGRMDESPRRSG